MSKYSRTYKEQIVKQCLSGLSLTKASVLYGIDRSQIRRWIARYRYHGQSTFEPKFIQRSPQEKFSILQHMWTNCWSIRHTCAYFNIPSHLTVLTWIRKYESEGISGLADKRKSRPKMTKTNKPEYTSQKSTKEMSVEELRAELEYRRAEVAVLKKLEALQLSKRAQTKKRQK